MRSGSAAQRAQNLDTVAKAFVGVSRGDADLQLEQYSDDMILELPFADPPQTVRGKEAARRFLRRAFRTYKMLIITITAVHECVDPDSLVIEFASDGHMATTGKPYANTYIGVFHFRNGLIRSQKEFFNPLISIRALTLDR